MRNCCYNCKWYVMGYGCKNCRSPYWCGWATIDDVCDEWEKEDEEDEAD